MAPTHGVKKKKTELRSVTKGCSCTSCMRGTSSCTNEPERDARCSRGPSLTSMDVRLRCTGMRGVRRTRGEGTIAAGRRLTSALLLASLIVGAVEGASTRMADSYESSVSYVYQSYNPHHDRGMQPVPHRHSSPSTSSSYSFAKPASYSSSIHVIPPNPNDPHPTLYQIQENFSPDYRHQQHQHYPYAAEGSSSNSHRRLPSPPASPFHPSSMSGRLLYSKLSSSKLHDDEIIDGRKTFKNPRNVPSGHCPRNEEAARRMGRTCLRKCSGDSDCLSRRKKCLCDGICGMSCIKPDKECGDLVNPLFGFVELGGRLVGSKAKYKCQEGYHLVGYEERVCQADGSWSGSPTECKENMYCTDPPIIANATHNAVETLSRFEANHTIQYSCEQGFFTKGFPSAKCFLYNNTMQWFGPEIECEPKSCGDPGEILNGFKDGNCFSYSCRVNFQCQAGFELIGQSDHYCQNDGSWSPRELPSCTPVDCPIPQDPENGRAMFKALSYNSNVSYECNFGYMIVGSVYRRCGPDKNWTEHQPQCKEINCGSPGTLYNGWVEGTRTTLDSVVHYRCNDGMAFVGQSDRTVCLANGTWSAAVPHCLAPCSVPSIEHGIIQDFLPSNQVSHGNTINVTCDHNYELAFGNALPECHNGTWTKHPKCQPARCKELPSRPRHGMVIAPKSEHGSRAKYRCRDGFELVGESTTICNYGNWTAMTPVCQEVYCPFPGYVKNGRVLLVGNMGMYDYRSYVKKVRNNRQIRYACNKGYYLRDGPPGATCVAGSWSPGTLPRCVPDLHPRIKWTRKRRSLNRTMAALKVSPGRRAEQFNRSLTLLNGTLHEDNTREELEQYFGIKTTPPNTDAGDDQFMDETNEKKPSLETFMKPLTESHYKRFHSKLKKSFVDEISSKNNLKGPLVDYYRILRVSNSDVDDDYDDSQHKQMYWGLKDTQPVQEYSIEMHPTSDSDGDDFFREASAEFSTSTASTIERIKRDAYEDLSERIVHRRSIKRKRSGRRKKKGVHEHCEPLPLEPYMKATVLRPGRDANYTYSSGARVKISCLQGHGLNINKTGIAKCRRGSWKPMKPVCEPLKCRVVEGRLSQFEYNGETVLPDTLISHGQVIRFKCIHGYNVLGSDNMRCWFGEWSVTGKNPECQPNPCQLPDIPFGSYKNGYKKGLMITHEASVEYSCDPGYLKVVEHISCNLGNIVPHQPSCEREATTTTPTTTTPSPPPTLPSTKMMTTVTTSVRTAVEVTGVASSDDAKAPQEMQNDGIGSYSKRAELISGRDLTSYTPENKNDCYPPEDVADTVIFRNGQPLETQDYKFPDGTKISYSCKDSPGFSDPTSENYQAHYSWSIRCSAGEWVGNTTNCTQAGDHTELDMGEESCIFEGSSEHVVTFHEDREVTEKKIAFPPGTTLVSRCIDIGKYMLNGSVEQRCLHGKWVGVKPICYGLSQIYNYSRDRPPTILFRHYHGPIGQTNDGQLMVYPSTFLALECLYIRRFGSPSWNVTQKAETHNLKKKKKKKKKRIIKGGKGKGGMGGSDKRYVDGWTVDSRRNRQLEYRLSLYKTKEEDTGTYTCTTPEGYYHSVKIIVQKRDCPEINLTAGLHIDSTATKLSSKVTFSCDPGYLLVGATEIYCKASGNWSAPIAHCKEARCEPLKPPDHGSLSGEKAPFRPGHIMKVTCNSSYILDGPESIVCQQNGLWSTHVPSCVQACTYPGTIISGTMSLLKYYYAVGDRITYNCSAGFVIHGSHALDCLDGAKWSHEVPQCLPIS